MRSPTISNWTAALVAAGLITLSGAAVGLGIGSVVDRGPTVGPQLAPMDDYGIRHLTAPAPLDGLSDYGIRHLVRTPALTPMDDYGVRHLEELRGAGR